MIKFNWFLFSRRIFHAACQLPPPATHGKLPHPGVRSLCSAGSVVLGLVLAQPRGHGRQGIAR